MFLKLLDKLGRKKIVLDRGPSHPEFYKAKLHTAKFYFDRLLTRTRSLVSAMESGADNLMNMEEEQFNIV